MEPALVHRQAFWSRLVVGENLMSARQKDCDSCGGLGWKEGLKVAVYEGWLHRLAEVREFATLQSSPRHFAVEGKDVSPRRWLHHLDR
jgi:hypothetical protein